MICQGRNMVSRTRTIPQIKTQAKILITPVFLRESTNNSDKQTSFNDIITLDHDLELSLDQITINRLGAEDRRTSQHNATDKKLGAEHRQACQDNATGQKLGAENRQTCQDNTTDQNAGENSYYTSIFTRKY